MRMIDIDVYTEAKKISWLRRIFFRKKVLYSYFITLPLFEVFSRFCSEYLKQNVNKILNSFLRDTFIGYKNYITQLSPRNWFDFLLQPLWYKAHIKVGGASVFYKTWNDSGVTIISDLMDIYGDLLSQDNFQTKYAVNCNFFHYAGIFE